MGVTRCDIDAILASVEKPECIHFQRALQDAYGQAEQDGDNECSRLLRVLSDAASLHLQPANSAEPFCPMMVIGDKRTAATEDFGNDELELLLSVVPTIVEPDLRARILDLVWIVRRDHEAAEGAVNSYIEIAERLEDPEMWPPAMDRLERASQIARSLGSGSESMEKVRLATRSMLSRHRGEDPYFLTARLIELLLELGGEDPEVMWAYAGAAVASARQEGDWQRAHTYQELVARCRAAAGDADGAREAKLAAAEVLVDQAQAAAAANSYFIASHHLQAAIGALRQVGKAGERVDELHALLLEYQKKSLGELKPLSVEADTEDLVREAVEAVSGLSLRDALRRIAVLSTPPTRERQRLLAEELVRDHPLQHLFSRVRVNEDGKVVARSGGGSPGDTEAFEQAVRVTMFQRANLRHQLLGRAGIEPARQTVAAEHDTSPEALTPLLVGSGFVPEDRRLLFARGLSAGFAGDYLTAAHVLIPQIENSVRVVLAANGIGVSSLDQYGIQRERDLNYLLYQDYTSDIFTDGVVFDLQALLVDPEGSNFRNLLAHGLLPEQAFQSDQAAYTWWVTIHLIFGFTDAGASA